MTEPEPQRLFEWSGWAPWMAVIDGTELEAFGRRQITLISAAASAALNDPAAQFKVWTVDEPNDGLFLPHEQAMWDRGARPVTARLWVPDAQE